MSLVRAAAFLGILLLTEACHEGGSGYPTVFPLHWAGVEARANPSSAVIEALRSTEIAVAEVDDTRADPKLIGSYDSDGTVVRASNRISTMLSKGLRERLSDAGANIGDRLGSKPIVLETRVIKLDVREGSDFLGRAIIQFRLSRNGTELWSGTKGGTGKDWGRTHNPENFQETLCRAFASAVDAFLSDENVAKAISGTEAASARQPASDGNGARL